MTTDNLTTALRACAAGLYPLEIGVTLLIANGTFLHREDFDWDAAITTLANGGLPCSGGKRRILELSASLAGGTLVDLRDAVTGLDNGNIARLVTAIRHASGHVQQCAGVECNERADNRRVT